MIIAVVSETRTSKNAEAACTKRNSIFEFLPRYLDLVCINLFLLDSEFQVGTKNENRQVVPYC